MPQSELLPVPITTKRASASNHAAPNKDNVAEQGRLARVPRRSPDGGEVPPAIGCVVWIHKTRQADLQSGPSAEMGGGRRD